MRKAVGTEAKEDEALGLCFPAAPGFMGEERSAGMEWGVCRLWSSGCPIET